MTNRFAELMFTPTIKELQKEDGSRAAYARFERPEFPARDRLTSDEVAFIGLRDSFYLATVTETGWPYVQHRGGPPGFLRVLNERTIGFEDYPGNRQFVSNGNIKGDHRVALLLMDYPNQRRLKILGRATAADGSALDRMRRDAGPKGDTIPSRAIIISIEAFDWNCPKYITPRFTLEELGSRFGKNAVRGCGIDD